MKHWQIYACFLLVGIFLTGCWIQEAPQEKKKALCVVSDYLTQKDSSVINRFAKDQHVEVTIQILSADAIIRRISAQRYNAEIDIILIENQTLRDKLRALGAFKTINIPGLFSQLDRQFNNKHHHWLPISHDPLVVVSSRDSSGNCTRDFVKRHRNDSISPVITIKAHLSDYERALKKSHHLGWIDLSTKQSANRTEKLYALSELVALEKSGDTAYAKAAYPCRSFLVDNKRFVTRVNTISICAHGRNHVMAEKFVRAFMSYERAIAGGRNELPTSKKVQPDAYIRSLVIR